MASNISVTWETVCDGKTREGANLQDNLKALIEDGYSLGVETPDGTKTFTDADAFGTWFDKLGPAT